MITHVFVYGTLQREQCRGNLWPRKPLDIIPGYVRGQLYDLGSYPALRFDDDELDADWVAGEVWSFTEDDIAPTIVVLDQIEETNQPGRLNLYDCCLVRAYRSPDSSDSVLALAYQYSTAGVLTDAQRTCAADRAAMWRGPYQISHVWSRCAASGQSDEMKQGVRPCAPQFQGFSLRDHNHAQDVIL